MTRQVGHGAQRAKREQHGQREQRGAALVEFSIVAVLLFTLILGVLVYGILLSKKQTVVQAANEAARVAVPMTYHVADGTGGTYVTIVNAATAQLNASLTQLGGSPARSCSDALGTTCTVSINNCASGLTTWCVFVTVTLDNKNHPLVVPIPFLSAINPDTLVGQASAQLATS